MIVRFDKLFNKALNKIKDKTVLKRIKSLIQKAELAEKIEQLSNIKNYRIYFLLQNKNRRF
jgi:hypothetical protein